MNKLAIHGGNKTIENENNHFPWPIITARSRKAILNQIETSISIYNRSGVFQELEDKFKNYHDMKYALLNNSGTSSILTMFEGINPKIGDEVICPTYTFFATVSPIMYMGLKPVFCDSDETGNIDPDKIEKLITTKTKAIIITHMWGLPCDMDKIVAICKKHNIYLFEDCSHAHGAEYKNQKVGTFGDASAWSLQGQKIVTGGEGGILLTNNKNIYERATLLGHYNKRCKDEIDKQSENYDYFQTGIGQKFRAHPLAIALANEQFDHLDTWLDQKALYAKYIVDSLQGFNFLTMPNYKNKKPSWYAFTIQFNEIISGGYNIETFIKMLHAEGLSEVDKPGSTCPIHNLPLFSKPQKILPRLYSKNFKTNSESSFEIATKFYNSTFKIPVWAHKKDKKILDQYIEGIKKVCNYIIQNPK